MNVLAIETATSRGGVALGDTEIFFEKGMVHGRDVGPAIESSLRAQGMKMHDLDLISCDVGPGSYTGIRVGLTYAKTLAWALGKPAVGVVSLDALAHDYARARGALRDGIRIAPALDAKWNQLYYAVYEIRAGAARRISGPHARAPESAFTADPPDIVFGDALQDLLKPVHLPAQTHVDLDPNFRFPRPATILSLGRMKFENEAADKFVGLEPLYLRPTEAEFKRRST